MTRKAAIEAAPSCGCVFCDVGLSPVKRFGVWVHVSSKHPDIPCAIRARARELAKKAKKESK